MPVRNLSEAAERLLDAAMALFADVLNRGRQDLVLIKHFPSKQAVLAEGVERFVEHARGQRRLLGDLDGKSVADAMMTVAKAAMKSFDRDSDALRIVWRDLESFPELQEKVRSERIRATFDDFSTWLGHEADVGRLQPHDSQAVAAVALSSLAFFQLLRFLMHDTPAGVDEDRFVDAWTALFVRALT